MTRAQWLTAGAALAAMGGSAAVTVESLAAYTGGSAEDFLHEFQDLPAFLCTVMAQGMDDIRAEVVDGTLNLPAGAERLVRALELWLDAHLARPWVRDLMLALSDHATAIRLWRQRINGFILMLQIEFEQIGWPRAAMTARLTSAAAQEIAIAEFEAKAARAELRQTFCAYLRH